MYGGSFNPPHIGHQMLALYLKEGLGAQQVWWVPSFQHPFGKPLTSYEHRVAMCELLAEPLGPSVQVSRAERELGGSGRTYDLLCYLIERYPQRRFALAVGSDILQETDKWHRWADITSMVQVVVVGRQGYPMPEEQTPPVYLPEISSTEIRRRLRQGLSVEGWVPISAMEYIRQHNLYQPETAP